MIGPQGMVQTGVYRAGVNQIGKGHLFYSAQALKGRMRHKLKNQVFFDGYEPMYGVVDDFSHSMLFSSMQLEQRWKPICGFSSVLVAGVAFHSCVASIYFP